MAHQAVLAARTQGLRVVFTDHSLFGFADASSILVNKVGSSALCGVSSAACCLNGVVLLGGLAPLPPHFPQPWRFG